MVATAEVAKRQPRRRTERQAGGTAPSSETICRRPCYSRSCSRKTCRPDSRRREDGADPQGPGRDSRNRGHVASAARRARLPGDHPRPRPDRPMWEAWSERPGVHPSPDAALSTTSSSSRSRPMPSGHRPCYRSAFPSCRCSRPWESRSGPAQRKAAEARAREEVRRALEELLACRADPARPGCERWGSERGLGGDPRLRVD